MTSYNESPTPLHPTRKPAEREPATVGSPTLAQLHSAIFGDSGPEPDHFETLAAVQLLLRLYRANEVYQHRKAPMARIEILSLMRRIEALPLVDRPVFNLTDYVTDEALDGLFNTLADEERRIRTDPLARTTELLKKWFGRSQ